MNEALERVPAVVFIVLFAGFWLWERLAAARPFPGDVPRRARNVTLSIVNFALGGFAGAAMLGAAAWIDAARWGLAALPTMWVPIGAGVLLLDMTDYWRHRLSHRVPALWRLHRLHHTDPRIDVTTALRSHPLEQMLRPLFLVAAIVGFGIPVAAVLLYPLIGLPVLLFQHANVRFPAAIDRRLAWVVSTPAMHLVHHSRRSEETDSNYATGLTFWDRLFGSFSPGPLRARIGLDGFDEPAQQTLPAMLATPWRRAARRN